MSARVCGGAKWHTSLCHLCHAAAEEDLCYTTRVARFLQFDSVSFSYPGMAAPLLSGVSAFFPEGGWTGLVGANGSGKTTLLKLAAGLLPPSGGVIRQIGTSCYAMQRTDAPPAEWEDFMNCWDAAALDWRRRLGVSEDWADRWDTLSHGERKRVQIALALWHAPDVLALDEPTNHLDARGKAVLLDALRRYRGAGLLVSHDRDFLDALCSQCLFLFPPRATMRPGGVTQGQEQDRREQAHARERHDANAGKARRLAAAAQQRREAAEQSAARTKRLKERKPPAHDSDGRFQRGIAKLRGKDGWGFSQSAALRTRAAKLAAPDASIRVDYELGFWLEGADVSRRNYVLDLPPGALDLGDGRRLVHPALQIRPDDRIALVGANGLGKSTLVRHLLPRALVPPDRLLVIPQEISEEDSRRIHADVKRLDDAPLGRLMTLVSRLGSRPARLLASSTPSPGEIRKILLAQGVARGPHLIVMDEPTNHLDLPSIECLETALSDTPCALLLVSHDARFLAKLARTRWELAPSSPSQIALSVVR